MKLPSIRTAALPTVVVHSLKLIPALFYQQCLRNRMIDADFSDGLEQRAKRFRHNNRNRDADDAAETADDLNQCHDHHRNTQEDNVAGFENEPVGLPKDILVGLAFQFRLGDHVIRKRQQKELGILNQAEADRCGNNGYDEQKTDHEDNGRRYETKKRKVPDDVAECTHQCFQQKIIINENGYCTFRSSAKYEKKTTINGSTGLEKIQRDLS